MSNKKIINQSNFGLHKPDQGYQCKFDWPEDCFCQSGANGIVFTNEEPFSYNTAFFEAFPRTPHSTFIRGEGKSVEEAEERAWNQWQKELACPGHEYERRGYENGGGLCKHCNSWKAHAFEPSTHCCICDTPTYFTVDNEGKHYCKDHRREKPLAKWTDVDWDIAYSENSMHTFEQKHPGFFKFLKEDE